MARKQLGKMPSNRWTSGVSKARSRYTTVGKHKVHNDFARMFRETNRGTLKDHSAATITRGEKLRSYFENLISANPAAKFYVLRETSIGVGGWGVCVWGYLSEVEADICN